MLIYYNLSRLWFSVYNCRAYKILYENINNSEEKLPEETINEIREIIEQAGGESEFTMSKEEAKQIQKEKKENKKKKRKVTFTPFDDNDWRS